MTDTKSANLVPAFACLALVFANHSLFRLGALSLFWAISLIAVVGAVALLSPAVSLKAREIQPLRYANIMIGLVLLMPLIASLVFGWSREFPFHGDHTFHNRQVRFLAHWLLAPVSSEPFTFTYPTGFGDLLQCRGVVLLALLAVTFGLYFVNRTASLVFALLSLTVWGSYEHSVLHRYPAGGYYLGIIFMPPAYLAGNVELIGRLTSVSAAVAWLFVLRPFLVGRWPDLPIMLVGILVLWQKDSIYIFNSSYLEPWAVIFLLLAVEILIVRGRDGAALSCLLVGCAAAVKEPPILALPFVWLAGEPWRGDWARRAKLFGCGLAAGFPFLLYLPARKRFAVEELQYDRPWTPGDLEHLLAYVQQFIYRMSISFSGPGLALAIFCLAIIPVVLFWPGFRHRTQVAILAAGGFASMLFIAMDLESGVWAAGEFRFLLCSLPLLAAGTIAFGYLWSPGRLAIVAALALALQLPDIFIAVHRSGGPTTARNFVENYNTPVVLPLRSILKEARQRGLLPQNATIRTNLFAVGGIPAMDELSFGPLGELYCECSAEHPYVLAGFVHYSNLNSYSDRKFGPYETFDRPWRQQLSEQPVCLAKLAQSCSHVLKRVEEGLTVTVLGIR